MDNSTQQEQLTGERPGFDVSAVPESDEPSEIEQWTISIETLQEMLETSDGIVSSRTLRPKLDQRGIVNAREVCVRLKLFDFENPEPDFPRPNFQYYYLGRSFYTKEAFSRAEAETEAEADEAERVIEAEAEQEEEVSVKKKYRQEEARLCKYVEKCLESLYASEYGPDVQVAYDIHNERPGGEFENMDVLAVHWRSDEVVELVGVEVKLEFSPRLVLQASNYKRFAHRVWAAVPVTSEEPGIELREHDSLLFEHVLEEGIGILACRKRQGGAFDVWPIHWPRLNRLDSIARDAFVLRYRPIFEEACVLKPIEEPWSPNLR